MDFFRTWRYMYPWQTLSVLCFLLPVITVTLVQSVRVARWAFRAVPSSSASAEATVLSSRVTLIAHSTRGLARAAIWLTCAAGAGSLVSAMILMESNEPMRDLVQQHLQVLEASATSFVLCAILVAASLAFDLVAARMRRQSSLPPALQAEGAADGGLLVVLRSPAVLGAIALVLVSWVLLGLRPVDLVVPARDPYFFQTTMGMLEQLWSRLAIVLAAVGVLTWVSTLFESAKRRRRLVTR